MINEITATDFNVTDAIQKIQSVIVKTPLILNQRLSEKYGCELYLKREDLQIGRSYKIRGIFNKIRSLNESIQQKGIVCVGAGNFVQAVAYSCKWLNIKCSVFMPVNTPNQKIETIKFLGGDCIEVFLDGDTYGDCAENALLYSLENELTLFSPFDDKLIIEGKATVGFEILMDLNEIDYLFIPVVGGGLAAGLGKYFQQYSCNTKLIGVEPTGAASMTAAFNSGKPVKLKKINPFVDGDAVRKVGNLTYTICIDTLYQIITVDEREICATIISLYDKDGIVAEPAGALSIAALANFTNEIKGKKVVCILSGGNNDSNRFEEIKKLADEWEELQHCLNDTF